MANRVLLVTSIGMLVFHFLVVHWFRGPIILQSLYVLGPITSVFNHLATSPWTLWTDRGVMAVGCVIDLWFASVLPQRLLLSVITITAVGFYACAKYFAVYGYPLVLASFVFHVAAHILVSVSHFAILYFYSKSAVKF